MATTMVKFWAGARGRWVVLLIVILVAIVAIFFVSEMTMPVAFHTIQLNVTEEVLIGIISDTHIPTRADEIPPAVKKTFQNASLIIHAGDIVNEEVIMELRRMAPTIAVRGNMDPSPLRETLPVNLRLKVHGWEIGIVHHPTSYLLPDFFGIFAERLARKQKFDILIFGHTHRPFLKDNDILIINPGSPTGPFLAKPSVALLNVSRNFRKGEVVFLD